MPDVLAMSSNIKAILGMMLAICILPICALIVAIVVVALGSFLGWNNAAIGLVAFAAILWVASRF